MSTNEPAAQTMPAPRVPVPTPETRRRHWIQNLIGIAIILGLCHYAGEVLAVALVSILLAFILAPVVDVLFRLRVPRGLGAAIAVLLLLAVVAGSVYYSYNQAVLLAQDLPKYAAQLREGIARFAKNAESFEVLDPARERGVINVRQTIDWTGLLTRGFGSVTQVLLAASFIPFLVYFMLTWQEHVRSATVMLFPLRNRNIAYVTLGLISAMIRSFMVGNLLIALLVGGVGTAVLGLLHLPFFYFVGFLSGFLTLIPYLGVVLALAPPIFVGIGHINSADMITVIATVIGLHVVAVNILYPKLLGNRVQLNPLAVTLGLLVWGWLWGAIGLMLAVPITATMKIIFDHVESLKPYGVWLGE